MARPDPFYYEKLVILNRVYHHTLIPYEGDLPGGEWIKTPLFPHQKTMVHRMSEYRTQLLQGMTLTDHHPPLALHGKMGIIGDDNGTGKTLSVLAYLASCMTPGKASCEVESDAETETKTSICELTPFSSRYFYSHTFHPLQQPSTHLIIVPHALFHEWKQEIQRHTTLPHVAIETRRMLRGDSLAKEMSKSSFVLTTNKCYKYVHEYAQQHRIQWNQIFLDEASSIYMNSSDPPFQFQFLWLITHQWIPLLFKSASFHRASLYHLRSHVSPLHPGLEEWLSTTHTTPYEETLVSSGFLKEYLAFHHPQRHHMVLRNAPPSLALPPPETTVIRCRPNVSLASLASYYHTRHVEPTLQSQQVLHLFQSIGVPFHPLTHYLSLHPPHKHALIQRKLGDQECVICLEPAEYPTMVDCCYHLYCGKCILKSILMNGKCPICRNHVHPTRITCFSPLLPTQRIQTKNKTEICLDWIRANPSGRIMVFSTFDNIFYQLFEEIHRMDRRAERLENHHFSLQRTVRNFKQGTTQILFVSHPELLRGLSFPFVTHLIFYHEPPSYEKRQLLIQSAHRVGRTQPLHVIHLHSEVQV